MIHTLNLLCGIGLFLFGMKMMSDGTESLLGEKLKSMLSVMAGTKGKAILTGTVVTGIIQSSTVVTVMAVGFVEAGILSIFQATGIVLGANIGTTVTSLIIAFNFSALTPVMIFSGVMMIILPKNKKIRLVGEILTGFGLLFLGLNTMNSAFSHLKENPDFLNFIVTSSQGKLKGIAAGTVMTTIMQSSSATVGILQSLCLQGLIGTESAVYIVLGQNIGTVFTAFISAVGKSRAAKQVGMIHLIFNVAGSAFFLAVCEFLPIVQWLEEINNPSMQVSLFHILFNVITVIAVIPFYNLLIKASEKSVRLSVLGTGIKKDKVH